MIRFRTKAPLIALIGLGVLATGCTNTEYVKASESGAATEGGPGLEPGTVAPDVTVTAADGSKVSLASLYGEGPLVVTFYRGAWCPYCRSAQNTWQERLDDVKEAGGTFVAITPEKTDIIQDFKNDNDLSYRIFSDQNHQAAKAFNVNFEVDEDTKRRYKGYGIDLAKSNADSSWELPAPATFVIDRQGIVRYAFADWDYKLRADPDEVIQVVRELR